MSTDLYLRLQTALGADYALERELGGGGMSRVFLAEEKRLGRRVVVKVLSPELAAGLSADRFEREIRLAAQLQDPRIVPLLTTGHAGSLPFYTMPFVEGESLRARLARGPVTVEEALGILRDVALALDYAHAHQVVHRDIKPENVLLNRRTAVVTDFGIAKAITAATEGAPRDTITALGSVVGTPAYMAPEQAAGGAVDHRTDLYAWGVLAYELLAGAHPFASRSTAQAVVAAHIADNPVPLSERLPHLPAPLVELVDRSLAKDPDHRPRNAAEILQVLDRWQPVPRSAPLQVRVRRMAWAPAVIALALAGAVLVGGMLLARRSSPLSKETGAAGASRPRSLAVLPFSSGDGDTANAYFAAGMAEELTTAFARVPGLRVASGGSASRFQDAGASEAEIARGLGVETVLEGTVRRSGERIRVTARLINPKDRTVLWADRYDRELAEVFEVQDEITQAIVTALRATLAGAATIPAASAPRGTEDLTAYDLYLKGRYYWGRRGEVGLRRAIGFFEQAVARDPNFARGHAGLSMAQVVLPIFATVSADSILALATRHAERALALDSTLAEAHLALAYARKMQWRWEESERHFHDALTLAPNEAGVHHWYGVFLYAVGRVDEAVAELTRAKTLDPLAGTIGSDGAIALYSARRYQEALAEARRDLAMDTTKSDVHFIIGTIELALDQPDSAVRSFKAGRRFGTGYDLSAFLSVAYRRLGRRREADSIYAELLREYRSDRDLGYVVAIAAIAAGDRKTALASVAQTLERRPMLVTEISLPCDPLFDPLKAYPQFATMLASVGMKVCPP